MLIEIIFKGSYSRVNFNFLKKLLIHAKEVRFNDPEVSPNDFNEIVRIIDSNNYSDFVINTDFLDIRGKIVPKVFINLSRDKEGVEVLFFFDLKDLKESNFQTGLNYLKTWLEEFQIKYDFEYFICQPDNADSNEYYFDTNGTGSCIRHSDE